MPESNESGLRLRDFRVLSVVLCERSLTRAAELLDTTQPSVSKVLARLRRHFGDPLFIRDGHALQPTAKALAIAEPLRGLLVAADVLNAPTPRFDPRRSERVFRIVTTDVGMARFLPPLVARLAEEGSRLGVRAVPLASRHFESKLETGEADLALGAFQKAPRGLRRQRLYSDAYVSVARRDHPGFRSLATRAGFLAARHIVVAASEIGHAAHQVVQHALESEIAPENIVLRLPSFTVATLVAAHTDGVVTIPANLASFVAERLGLGSFRPPLPLPPIEIAQFWHERDQRDPGHRWFRLLTFELFGKARHAAR